ncbi:MAG TPA: serine/threonine-protein kinase [Polyangiaceae bacterium]|nr:serine/threonine-protein kinase [Polyangiaceae bacterium]
MERQVDELVAGKYRLVRRLARGGMGSVWQAFHIDLHADVALKFIRPDADGAARSLARFQCEARLLAQLRSPHIVQVLDFGVDGTAPYIAMELLHGEDLALLLARRIALPPAETVALILEAARGLMVAHQAGVIHRDIKPSNLYVVDGQGNAKIKLIDFGIAKVSGGDSSETTEGLVLGSPAFMSPEQARGAEVSASVDVWSLAAVAFRMLTGRAPIEGTSPSDTVVRICTESPPLVSSVRPELGTAFDELFESTFRRSIHERLVDLEVFARRFTEALVTHDPKLVVLEGEREPLSGARLATAHQVQPRSATESTKPLVQNLAQPTVDRAQGRDSETASISLARNAPSSDGAQSVPLVRTRRWAWWGGALAVAMFGWGMAPRWSSALSTPSADAPPAPPEPHRSPSRVASQVGESGSGRAPAGSAPAALEIVPPQVPSAAAQPSAAAHSSAAVHSSPAAKRSRPALAARTPAPPSSTSPSATEPPREQVSPDIDPVFGLRVSEP